jgi:hypothetical protein
MAYHLLDKLFIPPIRDLILSYSADDKTLYYKFLRSNLRDHITLINRACFYTKHTVAIINYCEHMYIEDYEIAVCENATMNQKRPYFKCIIHHFSESEVSEYSITPQRMIKFVEKEKRSLYCTIVKQLKKYLTIPVFRLF